MNESIGTVLMAGFWGVAVLAGVRTVNAVRKARRHRTRANKRFLAAYRAGYRAARAPASRAAVEVPSPAALPEVRHRAPAGAIRPDAGRDCRLHPAESTAAERGVCDEPD